MRIHTFTLGSMQTNCYVLEHNGQAVAIDAGEQPTLMLDLVRANSLTLTHILCTHLHADHVCGVQEMVRATGAHVYANTKDDYLQKLPIGRGGAQGFPRVPSFSFDHLAPGKQGMLETVLLVLDTPGHTPGSLSFYFPKYSAIFVGDVLFHDSIGRADYSGGDPETLYASIRDRIFILPDETKIYAGHGPRTTVGREKKHNHFIQALVLGRTQK